MPPSNWARRREMVRPRPQWVDGDVVQSLNGNHPIGTESKLAISLPQDYRRFPSGLVEHGANLGKQADHLLQVCFTNGFDNLASSGVISLGWQTASAMARIRQWDSVSRMNDGWRTSPRGTHFENWYCSHQLFGRCCVHPDG